MQNIRVWHNVDRRTFDEDILPLRQPALLKGVVAHWPLVEKGLQSATLAARYLQECNPQTQVDCLVGDPAINGRFFYDESLSGVNYTRGRGDFRNLIAQLIAQFNNAKPSTISIQALSVATHLPRIAQSHALGLLPTELMPNVWIGNAVTVAPHFDLSDNVACVVCGRRRFTLFPPEQVGNLYVGPLEATPQGVPISLVDVADPDLERFPRFLAALDAAQSAELEPGDALYIPYLWWHSVQSLAAFNVLMNYWWNGVPRPEGAAFLALLHAIAAIRSLPLEQRDVWHSFFEHYVFGAPSDSAVHLPASAQGILGENTSAQIEQKLLEIARAMAGRARS